MELDHELCYRASKSRDERFDGRFFTTVLTTGIYCRPVCPAPTPKPENVRFVSSAAAAEAAGFRPCLRCRPETSPGSPDWLGTSATVSRALRLISEGVLDEHGLDEVAGRLHVGTRQLRRLFSEHLGVSPLAVAQNRRVLFARRLITETGLPMTDVAFGAGFSSIRRFNDAMRKAYGVAPTELRKTSLHSEVTSNSHLTLKLYFRPPFDWPSLIKFLGDRAIPGVEIVGKRYYKRSVRVEGTTGIIEVRTAPMDSYVLLSIPSHLSKGLIQTVEGIRRLFDLRADPMEISSHLGRDELLGDAVRSNPGLRVPGAWDGFEIAVRAILGQQVSVKAATTMSGRLVSAFGEAMPTDGGSATGLTHLFPTPAALADANLTALGLTKRRAEAICELARAVYDGRLSLGTSRGLDEAVDKLTEQPGVGPWTAHYIAMRALGEPDAFPAGDLVLRKAAAGGKGPALSARELQRRSDVWRPWRSYAAMHLWKMASS